ncbi:MAG: hypothetical protein AB3N21_06385 [Ruegeria sp.]|uniref:hypothetical protein n=1 Tax=Ruegeria sp. TaxID=1879320 RepID=UPI00349EF733
MTDVSYSEEKVPFEVGSIVGSTISMLFRKFPAIMLLGFLPTLFDFVAYNILFGNTQLDGPSDQYYLQGTFWLILVGTALVSTLSISLTTAILVQFSYDVKLGLPTRLTTYLMAAIRHFPAIFALTLVTSILCLLGLVLLVVPGLWLYAVFSVIVPVIVIEGVGFGAIRRSAELTKGYRWPIAGTLFLMLVCAFLLGAVFGGVAGGLAGAFAGGLSIGMSTVLEMVGNALGAGIFGIAAALIYARLKEIKEGVSVSDLVEVFK